MIRPHFNIVNFQAKSEVWQEFGVWSGKNGFYRGQVKAKKSGSLEELALLITGDSKDLNLLGKTNSRIAGGTIIDISPLLVKSEESLRSAVVKLTGIFKSMFPTKDAEIKLATGTDIPGTFAGVSVGAFDDISEINKYFAGQPYSFCDCNTSIRIIYSKAGLDLVGEDIFRAVCGKLPKGSPRGSIASKLLSFGSTPIITSRISSLLKVKNGDWIAFLNYEDYTNKMRSLYIERMKKTGNTVTVVPVEGEGAYQQENALKVGENQFWGFPTGTQTEQKWLSDLQTAYNSPSGSPEGKQKTERVPGFDGNVTFIDVVELVLAAFRYRAFESTYCTE